MNTNDLNSTPSSEDTSIGSGTGNTVPQGVDWWNVSMNDALETDVSSASLPLEGWAPLLPHDTGCMRFHAF